MTIRRKLVALVVLVALVPLVVSGVLALRIHQRAFDQKITELHRKTAETGAAKVQGGIEATLQALELLVSKTVRWGELGEAERYGALMLTYRQHRDIAVTALLDDKGAGVGTSVYRAADERSGELGDHPAASIETLSAFAQRIPFQAARTSDVALGEPVLENGAAPIVPIALPASGPKGARWVVAVGLSLASTCRALADAAGDGIHLFLLDGKGRILCGGPAGATVPPDGDALATTVTLPSWLGWSVLTRQPRSLAFAASRLLRTQALVVLTLALILSLSTGVLVARSITRPVRALVRGANELAEGNFSHRLRIGGSDELGQLGHAFDRMAGEVERRDAEIRAFNAELQQRVEERTRELKEAEAQLMQSKKIAAVSSLGAGIAHEINNPLTSVLGFAQVLRMKAENEHRLDEAKLLATVENESQRIRRIVQTLLTFSHNYAGESFIELDPNQVVTLALDGVELDGVEVKRQLDPSLPRVLGNAAQLQEVVVQLVKNAVTSMKGAGTLTVRTAQLDGAAVKLEVTDTGRGIAPEHLEKIFDPFFTTKDDWRGEGLGLTIVHRIVEQHHGRVRASSRPGEGATFVVTLPAATRRAHLQ